VAVARAGDVIDLPQSGMRLTFLKTSAETGGESLEMEQAFRPGALGGAAVLPHLHPLQSEGHKVLAGNLGLRVGRRRYRLGPGEEVVVPPGVTHRLFAVDDGREVRVRLDIRPALRREAAFEDFGAVVRAGHVTRLGTPRLLPYAVLAKEYADENHLVGLPYPLQAALIRMLAAIGRRRGYRPQFSEAST
jgi:quercetin dioxygenase-like cupin family protein